MAIKDNVKVNDETFIPKLYFALRIRGAPGMRRKILDTLKMLRMHKVNHGVLIWTNKSYIGMLYKCKDYIAFGEIDEETLIKLLRERGKIEGDKPLTDEHIKNLTQYKDIKEFSKALMDGKIEFKERDVYKIKPVFRLHPPRKGYSKSTKKKHYAEGGILGYLGTYINELILKML
jgi:large subunit ribosomal protein L30